MGVGVGNVQLVAGKAEATGLIEQRLGQPAAVAAQPGFALAFGRIDDFQLAIIGVGDVELAIAPGVRLRTR